MLDVDGKDILTRVTKYNLIRSDRMLHIDVHEAIFGKLAGKFVAVPNLINIIAKQEYQGTGNTEKEALENCLSKIKGIELEKLFPERPAPKQTQKPDNS
ncbi:MAG: hypothetical protein C0403_12335 [Desulfobacterium sp.]|nr:hypothetical protein [Desulfobacterium sp.]